MGECFVQMEKEQAETLLEEKVEKLQGMQDEVRGARPRVIGQCAGLGEGGHFAGPPVPPYPVWAARFVRSPAVYLTLAQRAPRAAGRSIRIIS